MTSDPAVYHVALTTDAGRPLLELDSFTSMEYVKVVDGVGSLTLRWPEHLHPKYLSRDNQIRVFRETSFRPSYLDFIGFLRFWSFQTAEDGANITTLIAKDPNELVNRRIIAYPSGTGKAMTSVAFVDDAMKDLANENMGPGATDTNRTLPSTFSVQGDDSAGPDIQKQFAWRNLVRTLNNLSSAARTIGNKVFWVVTPVGIQANGLLDLSFQTSIDVPGNDQSWKVGVDDQPMIFGLDYGNLSQPDLSYDYTDEVNHVYVGGGDQGAARTIVERSDTARIEASIYNRREAFVDARNEPDANLADLGDAALAEGRPRIKFSAKLLSGEQTPYGRWGIGDLVTVDYVQRFNAIIHTVTVAIKSGGIEDIWGNVEFEATI